MTRIKKVKEGKEEDMEKERDEKNKEEQGDTEKMKERG
jgi:hypothetical protein